MKLAILVLGYGNSNLLPVCLPPLTTQTNLDFDVWLINNGPCGDSDSVAKKIIPNIKILQIKENLGFSGGYNYAFKYLEKQKKHYNYYFALSNDVISPPNLIDEFYKVLNQHTKFDIFQPAVVDRQGIISECGGMLSLFTGRCPGNLQGQKYTPKNILYKSLWGCGCAFFIKRTTLVKVNYFDNYYAYFEDVDLGWKINNGGGLVIAGQNCHVIHYGATSFQGKPKTFYLIERNRIFAYWQNLSPLFFWLLLPSVIICRSVCLIGLLVLRRSDWNHISQAFVGLFDGLKNKHLYPHYNYSLAKDLLRLQKSNKVEIIPF